MQTKSFDEWYKILEKWVSFIIFVPTHSPANNPIDKLFFLNLFFSMNRSIGPEKQLSLNPERVIISLVPSLTYLINARQIH